MRKALLFIASSVVLLNGCGSTPEKGNVNSIAILSQSYTPPMRDNRLPEKEIIPNSSKVRIKPFRNQGKSSRSYVSPITSIVRCDEAVTVCKHGLVVSSVEYTVSQHSDSKAIVEGVFTFNLRGKIRKESDRGFIERSVHEGFPQLPHQTKSIPFSGVTGKGEVISVSGPYDTQFSLALNFERE